MQPPAEAGERNRREQHGEAVGSGHGARDREARQIGTKKIEARLIYRAR